MCFSGCWNGSILFQKLGQCLEALGLVKYASGLNLTFAFPPFPPCLAEHSLTGPVNLPLENNRHMQKEVATYLQILQMQY